MGCIGFADPCHFVASATILALDEDYLADLVDSGKGGDASAVRRDFVRTTCMRLKALEVRKHFYGNGDVQALLIATCIQDRGL